MAPEQAGGKTKEVGPAADVYALGAILYELLTGRPPFRAATPLDTLLQVVSEEPVPPTRLQAKVPRDLDTICLKCLQKDPRKRYASAEELANDLHRFRTGEPIKARPVGSIERLGRWVRRNPRVAGLLATLALVLMGGFVAVWTAWRQSERSEAAARRERDEAERQRQRAQAYLRKAVEAVDRMLVQVGDDKLGGVPQLQGEQRQLLQDAVGFYQGLLDLESDDPLLRKETAQAHFRIGRLYATLNKTSEAEGEFGKALTLQRRLADEFPDQPDYRNDLAATHRGLANVFRIAARLDRAEAVLNEAVRLGEGLTRDHPERPEYLKTFAQTQMSLGLFHFQSFHLPEAETALKRAVALAEELERKQPGDRAAATTLAETRVMLGFFYRNLRQFGPAEKALREGLAIYERLRAGNPRSGRELEGGTAWAQINLGATLALSGRGGQSEEFLGQGIATYEGLVRDYPEAPLHRFALAVGDHALGIAFDQRGKTNEAAEVLEKAVALLEALSRDQPSVTYHAYQLRPTYLQLGLVELSRNRTARAEEAFAHSLNVAERAYRESGNFYLALEVCGYLVLRSVRLEQLGRHADAAADLGRALALAEGPHSEQLAPMLPVVSLRMMRCCMLARTGDHRQALEQVESLVNPAKASDDDLYNLACVRSLCSAAVSRDATLSAGERESKAEGLAAGAVELLQKIREKGYFKNGVRRKHLDDDADLNPLRERADYKAFARALQP
jgi:serine/threonine-protein kinase